MQIKAYNLYFLNFLGHNEPGETDHDAAVRETLEETGLKSDSYKIIPGFKSEVRYMTQKDAKTVVFFLAELTSDVAIRLSSEHNDYGWLKLDAACEKVTTSHSELRRVLREAKDFLVKTGKYAQK